MKNMKMNAMFIGGVTADMLMFKAHQIHQLYQTAAMWSQDSHQPQASVQKPSASVRHYISYCMFISL